MEEEEEEHEVETVSKDNVDGEGEDINTNGDSDGDIADSGCAYDFETNNDDNKEGDIEVWYAKAKLFLDRVDKFSMMVCDHLGVSFSLDEMTKLFKGQSLMNNCTHKEVAY